jgi:hypothetical protein
MSTSNIPPAGKSGDPLLTPPPGSVDEMLAYYVDWRHDAAAVWDAYAAWANAPAWEKPSRFSAYTPRSSKSDPPLRATPSLSRAWRAWRSRNAVAVYYNRCTSHNP